MAKKDDDNTNPAAAFQTLLEKNSNDGIKLASTLFDENFQLREKNRDLRVKVPVDGSVVLTADEAKEWQAFQALGKKAEDVKKDLDSVETLQKQNKELSSMENLRDIADIGIDGSKLKLSVLKDQLARFPAAAITIKTEKDKDSKEAKVAYIKKDADSKEQSFTDFASAELADYLPSLKVSAEATSQPAPGRGPDPTPRTQGSSVFDRIREDVKKEGEASAAPNIDERFGRAAA